MEQTLQVGWRRKWRIFYDAKQKPVDVGRAQYVRNASQSSSSQSVSRSNLPVNMAHRSATPVMWPQSKLPSASVPQRWVQQAYRASAQTHSPHALSQGDLGSYCATATDSRASNGEWTKTIQFPAIFYSCIYPGPNNRCSCENTSHPAGRTSNREKERIPRSSPLQSTNLCMSCVWHSYQIHTVLRKSPNTGALRPSISSGKWNSM